MKQVPLCEENPHEAILTNIIGSENVAKVSAEYSRIYPTRRIKILSISTDKSCKPVNLYGMTKAIQERIHLKGNNGKSNIHNCVRYGNVLESTGSVIPIFKERINSDLNLNVTHNQMTRFLLSLAEAVDLIFKALNDEDGGKIFIPKIKSAKIYDVAEMLIKVSGKKLQIVETGIRPGEKIHEILISEEELTRTEDSGDVYIVHDIFSTKSFTSSPQKEYSSEDDLLDLGEIEEFLRKKHVI
jgi:UDP-glucose 4-epimerase